MPQNKPAAKEKRIDPYTLLVKNPESTIFLQTGQHMPEWDIHAGDMLVVDSSMEAVDGKKVVAEIDGELRLMRLSRRDDRVFLCADDREMEITGREHVYLRGVLKWVLREM